MEQHKLLTILYETKEDFNKSLQQALNRRFITDTKRFREAIAIVSKYIGKLETTNLSQAEIANLIDDILNEIYIHDLSCMHVTK